MAYRISIGKNIPIQVYQSDNEESVRILRIAKRKPKFIQKLVLAGFKKFRYYPINMEWQKGKEFHEAFYHDNPTLYKSLDEIKAGIWVTVVSTSYPVKGERYNEYYINHSGGTGTFKVCDIDHDYKEVLLYGYNGLTIEHVRLRPATPGEIDKAILEFKEQRRDLIMAHNKYANKCISETIEQYKWLD